MPDNPDEVTLGMDLSADGFILAAFDGDGRVVYMHTRAGSDDEARLRLNNVSYDVLGHIRTHPVGRHEDHVHVHFDSDPGGHQRFDAAGVAVEDHTPFTYADQASAPEVPASTGDVLDAVDADGALLCACGCGGRITDQSPSAYFASQACSLVWHATQYEQLGPPDAEIVPALARAAARRHAGGPAVPVRPRRLNPDDEPASLWVRWLTQPFAEHAVIEEVDGQVHVTMPSAELTHPGNLHPFLYRRHCDACGQTTAPFVTSSAPAGRTVRMGQVTVRCFSCTEPLPGRALFGRVKRVDDFGGGIAFFLEDGVARAAYHLSRGEHESLVYPHLRQVAVDRAWWKLERKLETFTASWSPPPAQPAPGDDVPYQVDMPPPPRPRLQRPWQIG